MNLSLDHHHEQCLQHKQGAWKIELLKSPQFLLENN